MIINIQGETLELENDSKMIQKYFDTINEILEKRDLQFSHFVIDGLSVYDDFFDYFKNNIAVIENVEVEVLTVEQLVNDTILSTYEYIKNATIMINPLAEEFYKRPEGETWKKLVDLFEGVQWVIETLYHIDSIKTLDQILINYSVWNEYVQSISELNSVVPVLEEAMINKDNVLIGDILSYEIVPIFKKMEEKLLFLIPRRGDTDVS